MESVIWPTNRGWQPPISLTVAFQPRTNGGGAIAPTFSRKMPWMFSINEVSAGHFVAIAKRDTGQSISKDGSDDVIPDLIQDAYRAEVTTGALDSKAAFDVTLDYLGVKGWEGRYHERAFGSWSILNRLDSLRAVHFDGRDFYVMVSREARGYSWQGTLSELEKGRCHYFREIATL